MQLATSPYSPNFRMSNSQYPVRSGVSPKCKQIMGLIRTAHRSVPEDELQILAETLILKKASTTEQVEAIIIQNSRSIGPSLINRPMLQHIVNAVKA